MLAWFSIAPDDGSGSYSRHVAAAVEVLEESGLPYRLGAGDHRLAFSFSNPCLSA